MPALGAGIISGSVAAIQPPPSINGAVDPNVLLVATPANGEIETHWLPPKVSNKTSRRSRGPVKLTPLSNYTKRKIDGYNFNEASSTV
jgi:hypothetical protein